MSTKIENVSCENCYGRAKDPEGNDYEYKSGVMVHATSRGQDDNGGYTDHLAYIGVDGCDGQPQCFEETEGNKLADRVRKAGCINSKLWWAYSRCYDNDVPDYVEHWYRPEFN